MRRSKIRNVYITLVFQKRGASYTTLQMLRVSQERQTRSTVASAVIRLEAQPVQLRLQRRRNEHRHPAGLDNEGG